MPTTITTSISTMAVVEAFKYFGGEAGGGAAGGGVGAGGDEAGDGGDADSGEGESAVGAGVGVGVGVGDIADGGTERGMAVGGVVLSVGNAMSAICA